MDEKLLRDMQPFWNSWYIDGVIGEGSYGSVYRVVREEFGQKYYSALKIISTPKNKSELKQALMEGMSESEAQEYFKSKAEEIYKEIIMMAKLKGKSSIVSYEDHQVVERKNGEIGYDILIRMELLKGLNDYVMVKTLEIPEIVRMGKEICRGLVICQNNGIMHRDIKPDNIFVTMDDEFKLGDFGIARKMESLEHGFTIRGTYEYMAPEVYHGDEYDGRVDVYSLGIVLYMFLNKKKTPFLPTDTTKINHAMRQEALKQRFSGEQMETPMLAGEELSYVIMKAIAYDPETRFQTAKDFLSALEALTEEDLLPFEGNQEEKNKKVLERIKKENEPGAKEPEEKAADVPVEAKDLENTVSIEESKKKEEFEEGTVLQDKKPEETAAKDEKAAAVKAPENKEKADNKNKQDNKEKADNKNKQDLKNKSDNENEKAAAAKVPESKDKPVSKEKADDRKADDRKAADNKNEKPAAVKASAPIKAFDNKAERTALGSNPYGTEKKKGNTALIITLISFVAVIAVIIIILIPHDPDTGDQGDSKEPVEVMVSSPEPDVITEEPSEEPTVEPSEEPSTKPDESDEPTETPTPEPITDFPDANSSELEEITELENYQYATSINIMNNRVMDLSPLGECIYIEKLQASYNRISDITVLEKLETLRELDLIHNAIEDISPLAGLTELTSLKLANNNVSDLTALAGLSNLEELDLSGNSDITDLTPILGLSKLKNVYILDIDGLKKKQVNELRELVEGNGGMLFE